MINSGGNTPLSQSILVANIALFVFTPYLVVHFSTAVFEPMRTACPDEFICFAEELADAARVVALKYFRNLGSIEYKRDGSPVTAADRETEAVIRQMIAKRYPAHSVVGEEHGRLSSSGPWSWVIDPIDGTRSFITGKPTFGCLIALLYEHQPVLGIIDMPALDERWVGETRPFFQEGRNTLETSSGVGSYFYKPADPEHRPRGEGLWQARKADEHRPPWHG